MLIEHASFGLLLPMGFAMGNWLHTVDGAAAGVLIGRGREFWSAAATSVGRR